MNKKLLSLVLATVMLLTCLPFGALTAFAADINGPKISIVSQYAAPNSSVQVDLKIINNPGIAGAKLTIAYDSKLTLIDSVSNGVFSLLDYTKPGTYTSPCNFNWDSESAIATEDGTFLTLTFTVSAAAEKNDSLPITVTYRNGDIYDSELTSINVEIENAAVRVLDYIPGDVNNDKEINGKDVTLVRRFNAGGYGVIINEDAANVNEDNVINGKDVTLIRRYIAGGYDVELKPSPIRCMHDMTATEAVEATCEEDGNISYWYCSKCEKYFSDAEGTYEIYLGDTILAAKGHSVVVDPAVPATETSTGLTEGSHCSVCLKVLVEQEVIPIPTPKTANITYRLVNNDSYLASQTINNPNPSTYVIGKGLTLSNDLDVPGYTFAGWYDSFADNATQIKSISTYEANDITLYAHWVPYEYKIQFESDLIPVNDDVYTVNQSKNLPTPKISGYNFIGWSDDEGTLIKRIPAGTTGDQIYTANWTSERRKTYTKPRLDEPIIVEDEENDMILFTYEIGEIQNVPVYEVHDFGKILGDGVTRTKEVEYSTTVQKEEMVALSQSVAKATTESSDWTLSSNWNKTTSLDEQDYTEKGLTKEQAETIAKSKTDTWNVSSGTSGSSTTTSLTQNEKGWANTVKVNGTDTQSGSWTGTHEQTHEEYKKNSLGIDAKLEYTPKNYNVSLGFDGASLGLGSTGGLGGSIGGSYKHEWGSSDKTTDSTSLTLSASKSRGFEAGGTQTGSTLNSTSTANTSSWNSSSSMGGSSTASRSETVSTAISEKIAKTYHYGESTCEGGANSESKGLQQTQSESDEYSSSVKYSTAVAEKQKESWTTQATKEGYHRWVKVNTAHVFGVVGYDMSTKSYFVYTYSVMDDAEPKDFEDYSYVTGKYNDNENGVIAFSIPDEVAGYVAERTAYSKGLKVDQTTGTISEYTGTDEYVIIPEYYNIGDGDVVKITGIDSKAFEKTKENIKAVRLSDFITEIPAGTFDGCTALLGVNGGNITAIGEGAFKGCVSIENCLVDNSVTVLGNHAFEGCDRLLVNAANSSVVEAAANSGVKKIQLYVDGAMIKDGENALKNITLNVPNDVELFIMNGYGYTYSGFRLNSDANETVIYKTHFSVSEGIPIQTSSSKLVLNQVNTASAGWGLVMSADSTELVLQSTVEINTNTDKTVLCKGITLSELKENVDGVLKVSGKVYVAGSYDGTQYLFYKGNEIQPIDADLFESYLKAYKIRFDANGGTVSETEREAYFGTQTEAFPTPTRDYYDFDGWFTENGSAVTPASLVNNIKNITLYAHWAHHTPSGWVKASQVPAGAEIVSRKYLYDLTSYTSSTSSSMPGWTPYGTPTTSYGSWGSWSGWTTSPISGSDTRDVGTKTEQEVSSYNLEEYNYMTTGGARVYYKTKQNINNFSKTYGEFHRTMTATPGEINSAQKVSAGSYANIGSSSAGTNKGGETAYVFNYGGVNIMFFIVGTNYKNVTYYRYRDRTKTVTYYFYKVESKESTSNPTGGTNVSNVVEWVQYRAK